MQTFFSRIKLEPSRLLYFVRELLLIFIGVTLSIQFSNWNDSRRLREEEHLILKGLRASLKRDLQEVNSNLQARSRAKKACETILQLSRTAVVFPDSLDATFAAAYQTRSTDNETSSYENLKSKGFDLISNDSLRLTIIALYDTKYPRIHDSEQIHRDLFFNTLIQFNSTRFNTSNPIVAMKPMDYNKLLNDIQYRYYLNVLIFYNEFLIGLDEETIVEIKNILSRIEMEIGDFG